MSSAKITMIGLYYYDDELFDDMIMPTGIDSNIVRDTILLRCGEFEVLYPDADFMKEAIKLWSQKWQRTFTRWVNALSVEYEPLNNYDRTESWTTSDKGSATSKSNDVTAGVVKSTDTDRVSAYNSNTLVDDKQKAGDSSSSNTSNTRMESETLNDQVRTGRAYGNIGVTTSQQMLQAELDVSAWNLYEHIADVFAAEFVIPVF